MTSPPLAARAPHPRERAALEAQMAEFNAHEGIPWSPATVRPAVERLLADPTLGGIRLLALAGTTVGYFVVTWGFDLEWGGRDAYLTELYLEPEVRGRGLGRAALALAEAFAREGGAAALHLMVRPDNMPASRLYASAGYQAPPRVFLTRQLEHG